ncbi:hypothetical protein C9J41_05930 [Photobacterium sp. GB-50]|uniref:hypothetical protein n=1 Tax=Photobacterium sp. GB-50 TaxID=2022107 RepID=UPI000D164EDD|nr:hypothetical protein [Photobacterium sp. GB-50]PSW74410.1 hypothetical protein C9J41_05930 [Photobacterium sp. GB-50]
MHYIRYFFGLIVIFYLFVSPLSYALTESGTIIKNQVGATYKDSNNITRSTASNIVETFVQPVVSVTVSADQTKFVAPSGTVRFNHIITNTGNDEDSFTLSTSLSSTAMTSIAIYPDENNDGIEDESLGIISSIGPLAPGESYHVVLLGAISPSASNGDTGTVSFTATSQSFANNATTVLSGGASSAINTDTVTVTNLPIIEMTKSMNQNEGSSPSGPYVVTLSYSNVGLTDMSLTQTNGIMLSDELPVGMRFNGNVTWSLSSGIIGDISSGSVSEGDSDLSFTSCIAGAPSCLSQDKVSFTLDGLSSNQRATISFEVMIDSGLVASRLTNQVTFGYDEDNDGIVGASEQHKYKTNTVPFTITPLHAVVANTGGCGANDTSCNATDNINFEQMTVASAAQGSRVSFTNYIWNLGNDEDTFNLELLPSSTFPAGTSFMIYAGNGVVPLLDNDGDSKVDTGVIPAAGSTCPSYLITAAGSQCGAKVIVTATLPPGSFGGGPYFVALQATSSSDTSQSDTVGNQLTTIAQSTVDITINYPSETSSTTQNNCDNVNDGCGYGAGVEGAAVVTNTANPSTSTTFTIFITNTSTVADTYVLDFSNVIPFSSKVLTSGFTVVYTDTNGTPITNIPLLLPDESIEIRALVSIDQTVGISTENLYFKVSSPSTGAEDTVFTAVSVELINIVGPGGGGDQCLVIGTPNQSGVTQPGRATTYKHIIDNNTAESYTGVSFSLLDSEPGFTSMIYLDSNGNGEFDGNDTKIDSTVDFAPLTEVTIFLKVTVDSNVPLNTVNNSSISATVSCGDILMVDSTTVANISMRIIKEQAKDAGCDGIVDAGSAYSLNSFSVAPGECILYRLTAENIAIEDAHEVVLTDATPAFTTFKVVGGIPNIDKGSINIISDGSTGAIIGNVGTVAPGERAVMEFAIRVDD